MQFTAHGQTHTVWYSDSPLAISPDGKLLAQVGIPLNEMEIWDIASGQKVQGFMTHEEQLQFIAFSRDGRSLLTFGWEAPFQGETEYSVKVWDVATSK